MDESGETENIENSENIDSIDDCDNESVVSNSSSTSNVSLTQRSFSSLSLNQYEILEFEFIVGERADSKILFTKEECQMYSYNCTTKLGKAFLCVQLEKSGRKRVCKCRVILVENDTKCIKLITAFKHNHLDNKTARRRELVCLNEIKRRCSSLESFLSTTRLTVRDIFNQVILE